MSDSWWFKRPWEVLEGEEGAEIWAYDEVHDSWIGDITDKKVATYICALHNADLKKGK